MIGRWEIPGIFEWGGLMVSSTCLKEKFIVYTNDMNIYCEVYECSIKNSGLGRGTFDIWQLESIELGVVILW